MAKVFISHRGSDTQLAEKLSKEIENAGHTVWLDANEILVGDVIAERISKGLNESAYVVFCLSSEGVETSWMDVELFNSLHRELEGQGVKVLPVHLSGRQTPAIIAGKKYADLMSDWDKGVAALLRAIR